MNMVQEFNYELFGDEDLWTPTQAFEEDACYDIRARAIKTRKDKKIWELGQMVAPMGPGKEDVPLEWLLPVGHRVLVLTGIFIELRAGWEALVRPRSGLAWKNAITVRNSPGTIDAQFRDEVCVILCNDDWEDKDTFVIKRGDRIAQLAIREVPPVKLNRVKKISREFDRGGGFGHSGVQDFVPNEKDYLFLKVGDKWMNGDVYGVGWAFVIGTKQTSIKEGDVVAPMDMCYRPRRKIKKTEA